jgi:hypothetical protein
MKRWAWTLPAVLALVCCEKTSKVPLHELTCGAVKLRFEETTVSNVSVTRWEERLLRETAGQWVTVDQANVGYGFGPETFSRLIAPDLAYHALAEDPARPRGTGRPAWTVFVDPAQTTRADYEAISACIASNAAAIDRALAAPRPGGGASSLAAVRSAQVTGTIYGRYDEGFARCGGKTLGSRWDCADGRAYIKTVMYDQVGQLRLCQIDPPPAPGQTPFPLMGSGDMTVAAITEDQAWIYLHEPTSWEREKALHGQDARAYYATCRDAAGRTIFDTFKVAAAPSTKGDAGHR